jgi:HK97 family phage major capsid protein
MTVEVKQLFEKLNTDWETFKEAHTQQLEELKTGKADAVLAEKVDRINGAISDTQDKMDKLATKDAVGELREDMNDIERKLQRRVAPDIQPEQQEHSKAFVAYMRDRTAENAAVLRGMEQKAVTIGTATAGGHAVPAPIAAQVLQKVLDISPVAAAVRRTPVVSPLYERLVDVRGTASGWAGETDTRSETGTPTIQQVTFTHGELYGVPKISNWALNDIFFDVTAWITESLAEEFAYQLGEAITDGNGTNKPTGIVTGTPVTTADEGASPERAFGTLQYVKTGIAAAFPKDQLGSPIGDPVAVMIDTVAALKPRYQANARWMMNRTTEAVMRKWRDANGLNLWQPSIQAGVPATMLGFPILPNEGMSSEGADNFPVAFGDYFAGYELIVIQGMRLIRDDVTSKGHVLFYFAQRFGGKLVNDDAIKLIKCEA